MNSTEAVQDRIKARRDGEVVDPSTITLENRQGSAIIIRPVGGVLESLTLVDHSKRTHLPYELLYSDGETSEAKRTASHMMSPAGPFEGLGGQHGAGRWLDWHVFQLNPSELGNSQVALQAKREDSGETMLRRIELGERHADFETAIVAPYVTDLNTSIGEHFYFNMSGPLTDVAINGKDLRAFTGDDDVFEKLRDGIPINVKQGSPLNVWLIDLPGQPPLMMQTQLFRSSGYTPSELWIWRREGVDEYLCIEPVVGVSHENGYLENDLLRIPAGQEARLQTSLKLLV